jgi:L-asparaginase II
MARSQHRNPQFHDCSGKHAGMLLASVRAGWDPVSYLRRTHPLQRRILTAVQRGTGERDVDVGVDGCGAPVHGVPLSAMATLYARLAETERMGPLAETTDRAIEAMLAEPYLVGGRDRDDTEIMRITADVVAKEGAEALDCAGILSSGLGVAVKVADGGFRAAGPAMIEVLATLGAVGDAELAALEHRRRPSVQGGGRAVGWLEPVLTLRRR